MNKIQKIEQFDKEENKIIYKKIDSQLNLLLEGQEFNQQELRLGFIGLAKQNCELLDLNQKLTQQVAIVLAELNALKKEREDKIERREKWAGRKRLPKRDPINSEIYNLLMGESDGPSYTAIRTRIAICLLTVTGIRIGELLPLKLNQLETLVNDGWISIDRLKKGPANHKAFLTAEGKKTVAARKKDFQFLFLMKDKDSYIFTSDRKPAKMLRRETITTDINKIMQNVSERLPDKPRITSHSFRVGYISELWRDTRDIEFVKQTIGHRSLNATSGYVINLTDEEREKRISSI